MRIQFTAIAAIVTIILTSCTASSSSAGILEYRITSEDLKGGNTRIEVFKKRNDELIYTIVLKDIYTHHFHPYEFHNGNLYVMHRTGGTSGYVKYPDTWIDALWRYDKNKNGIHLYSVRGFAFSVAPDEKHIAISTNDSLIVLNQNGSTIRKFSVEEFNFIGFDDLSFTNQFLFFSEGGPESSFHSVIKMNLKNFTWSELHLPGFAFDIDYSFNPSNEMVVGSNYPFMIDEYDSWVKEKPTVTLYLYDFRLHKKSVIATSIAKEFAPEWIDNSHIEINDPASSKRIVYEIKQ